MLNGMKHKMTPLAAAASMPRNVMFQTQFTSFGATNKSRDSSGLYSAEFDYDFASKIDHGNFPHNYHSFMKVLGADYDTTSQAHQENLMEMTQLNLDLMENVESTMTVSQIEQQKLEKRDKFDARERIRRLLDAGSPWLAIGQLAGFDEDIPSGNLIAGIGQIHGT